MGSCSSAATFVMLSCTERLATPNSRFLIHSARRVSIALPVNATVLSHLQQLLREMGDTEREIEKLYLDRLTPRQRGRRPMTRAQKLAFVRKLIARGDQAFDKYMFAEEAIDAGLITGLFTGKLDIMPKA
jgi:ATP-dependent protease ClpP protease subunit